MYPNFVKWLVQDMAQTQTAKQGNTVTQNSAYSVFDFKLAVLLNIILNMRIVNAGLIAFDVNVPIIRMVYTVLD